MKTKSSILAVAIFFSLTLPALRSYAERPVRGVYAVPVDGNLTAYSKYPVKFKSNNYQTEPTHLDFPLPAALVGEEKIISLDKINETTGTFVGTNAKATCATSGRYFTCNVKFNDLAIDPQKVETAIKVTYASDTEASGRLAVARRFGSEPIGIISYKLRGRDRK